MKGRNLGKWNKSSKPRPSKPLRTWKVTYKGPNSYRTVEYVSSRKPTLWANNQARYGETVDIQEVQ